MLLELVEKEEEFEKRPPIEPRLIFCKLTLLERVMQATVLKTTTKVPPNGQELSCGNVPLDYRSTLRVW